MSVRLSVALARSFAVILLMPIGWGLGVPAWAQEPAAPDAVAAPPDANPDQPAAKPRRHRSVATAESQAIGEFAGRYAVMRDKRDTGCMVTLDAARIKGGERAQLAPGCRDQGIVIFDPTVWQIVKGELVLTARAGHKAHMLKDQYGNWQKDPKDGGKPLGLKRL